MDSATIGAILKNRIKECGFTQEDFAEKIGIGYSALKKYISGKNQYTYELLMKFSEELKCSYDYLLGYSKSPEREFHEVKEIIGLSDEAIKKLAQMTKRKNPIESIYNYNMDMLNEIICHDSLLTDILLYCGTNMPVKGMMKQLFEMIHLNINDTKEELNAEIIKGIDTIYLTNIMYDIRKIKESVNEKLLNEEREDIEKVKVNLDSLRNA